MTKKDKIKRLGEKLKENLLRRKTIKPCPIEKKFSENEVNLRKLDNSTLHSSENKNEI